MAVLHRTRPRIDARSPHTVDALRSIRDALPSPETRAQERARARLAMAIARAVAAEVPKAITRSHAPPALRQVGGA